MTRKSITYKIHENDRDANKEYSKFEEYYQATSLLYEMIEPTLTGLKDDTFAVYCITNFAEDYSDLIYLISHQYNNYLYNNDPDHRRVIEYYERNGVLELVSNAHPQEQK
uniref:Uncharacterized protein n=1 Tax=Acrobeloides nanus TaxID=290746 RepID=A0A914EB12_9BILA